MDEFLKAHARRKGERRRRDPRDPWYAVYLKQKLAVAAIVAAKPHRKLVVGETLLCVNGFQQLSVSEARHRQLLRGGLDGVQTLSDLSPLYEVTHG